MKVGGDGFQKCLQTTVNSERLIFPHLPREGLSGCGEGFVLWLPHSSWERELRLPFQGPSKDPDTGVGDTHVAIQGTL